MTTRSGRNYKAVSQTMDEEGIADLMKVLIEDRKSRDAQFEEERKRQLQAAELEKAQMREQMEMLRKLVEDSRRKEETRTPAGRAGKECEAKLVKLSEQDDIEAYLTTFERVMRAYEIKEERWAVKLAPYLTGKAQLAYAAMRAEDTGSYRCLKDAILRRYDISEETYRRRFREAVKKEEETVSARELTVRLNDLLQKWTKECKTVEDIRDMMVQERLLDALPRELKIWVAEGKPKTSKEAAELVDNYLRARKHEHRTEPSGSRQDKGSPWSKGTRDARDAPKVPSGRETLGGQRLDGSRIARRSTVSPVAKRAVLQGIVVLTLLSA